MPGARSFVVLISVSLIALSACTTVAPAAETAPSSIAAASLAPAPADSLAPVESPGAEVPSFEVPTTAPATEEPPPVEPEPTQPPEPIVTEPPAKTNPPKPENQPNLVVSEFVVEEDPVLVGVTAHLTATVNNTGSADAGPFIMEIVLATAGQSDLVLESKAFDEGLAAGGSTQLTTTVSPNEPAGLRLVARADVIDGVSESDESDNERVLEISVLTLGNLAVPADGLTVTPNPDSPGTYLFYFTFMNSGPSTLVTTVNFKFFANTDASVYVEWGTHNIDIDLAPDASQQLVVGYPVDPGTYRAYVLADSDNTLQEVNEEDNEAFYDFTAP